MEPEDDPRLGELLKEWRVTGAPPWLDERILRRRKPWWRFLLTGSVRVPVPVGVAIAALLLVMAAALLRQRPAPAPPPGSPVSLVDFRPVDDPQVRVFRGPL